MKNSLTYKISSMVTIILLTLTLDAQTPVMAVSDSFVFEEHALFLASDTNETSLPSISDQGRVNPHTSRLLPPVIQEPLNPARFVFHELVRGLVDPLFITHAGDGSGRLFVVERAGRIRIIKSGNLLSTPFLDIQSSVKATGGEQGLLALAFHPSYKTNGQFFVIYTAPQSGDANGSNLILERYTISRSNPDQASTGSGTILLPISHPTYSNHNGGALAFGQDGYLYWSTGDGGGAGDPNNNAQNLNSLLGKILRIDVDSNFPYQIPAGNPFYSSPDPNIRKEIWAYGLRNPWRFSFDRLTYDLYIGDVGQGAREEVDFQAMNSQGGENYGWRIMEGSLCYNPASGCDQSGKQLPVAEYSHSLGCSVTGGHVYRGSNYPPLAGYYFYGDFCSGRLFNLYRDPENRWTASQIVDSPYQISTFGEDERGELYLADYATGKIYNIQYASLAADTTGVFRPSNGVIFLKNTHTSGFADIALNYGLAGDYPVVGDWDGDGDVTIGVYRNGRFLLSNSNTVGFAEINFLFGQAGDQPIAGDWDGDGDDTIGVYRNGRFLLRNSNTVGFAEINFLFGQAGDQPIAGDWDGDGDDTIGVYRPSTGQFLLRNSNDAGPANDSFFLGNVGDVAIAGDWDGDGDDTTGVFRPSNGVIFLKNTNATGFADVALNYGLPGDKPVVGDWDGDDDDTIGVFRSGRFYLRNSNTNGFAEIVFDLGFPTDMPIAGNWDGLP